MNTSLTDDSPAGQPLLLRLLVVTGALFGFTLLALAVSGAADASEGSPPPDRPGLLDRAGNTVHEVLKPAGPALKPVMDTAHLVSSQAAPAVKAATSGLEPVVAPLTRPVLHAAEPLLSAVGPVTQPVLHAVSPVTSPAGHATAPVTAPAARAVGGEHAAPAVSGHPADGTPTASAPRGDVSSPPAAPAVPSTSAAFTRPVAQHPAVTSAVRHAAGHIGSADAGVAGPEPGTGGGGMPADLSGTVGAVSASAGSAHGSEFAVTESGFAAPGTDRAWRAPPGWRASPYWLVFYGNDHPS
ncbi:hypothetical protein [Amycolatopsis rubida]|uniref:Uncharacterized protein n=1 Tax=Amycolatopsis rubida TaxID=112413 RepID=A0A1I5ZCA1_9PSEU|nr:hypothetical protein [Amycolatopsis rubida]SFQ54053.1 hypothetical protein SAMN05421854_114196 [Amycolatopsis rubida]